MTNIPGAMVVDEGENGGKVLFESLQKWQGHRVLHLLPQTLPLLPKDAMRHMLPCLACMLLLQQLEGVATTLWVCNLPVKSELIKDLAG